MTLKETIEVSATILVSLGGGGAIVRAFAGYLGKRWADTALEEQKQKYAQLNMAAQNQFEIATRRVQSELDKLGVLHKLRTEDEFGKIKELWTHFEEIVAQSRNMLHENTDIRIRSHYFDHDDEFIKRVNAARDFMNRETLTIPKHIVAAANGALLYAETASSVVKLSMLSGKYDPPRPAEPDDEDVTDDEVNLYVKRRDEEIKLFRQEKDGLEVLLRDHLQGLSVSAK